MKKAVKRKRCSTKGCKKLQALAFGRFCKVHGSDPTEQAMKCTDVEALTFSKTEAELMTLVQGATLVQHAIDNEKIQSAARIQAFELKATQLAAAKKSKQSEYDTFVSDLAKKYGIGNPREMAIDPDLCTIRDLAQV